MHGSVLAGFAALAIGVCGAAQAAESCPQDWQARAVGVFVGKLGQLGRSAGPLHEVQTKFILDNDGALQGAYVDHDPTGANPGTLQPTGNTPCRATFRWHDRYGEGVARFEFTADGTRFKGAYGSLDQKDIESLTIWTGRRP